MINNFFSSKTNLTILQFILLSLIAYIMGSHLETGQFVIMLIVVVVLQFITHIKGIADGMLYNQLLNDNSKNFKKLMDKIKKKKLGE
tara:strand:+ start:178 stop:438 length:261 start_codon:yes stop_codon:yes gene_type:complete